MRTSTKRQAIKINASVDNDRFGAPPREGVIVATVRTAIVVTKVKYTLLVDIRWFDFPVMSVSAKFVVFPAEKNHMNFFLFS